MKDYGFVCMLLSELGLDESEVMAARAQFVQDFYFEKGVSHED